jgi:hypothetical protein
MTHAAAFLEGLKSGGEPGTALIERYLNFYRDLETGRRQPSTEAQRYCVAVSRCEAKSPTAHEIAYFKYCLLNHQGAEAPPSAFPSEAGLPMRVGSACAANTAVTLSNGLARVG